MRSIQCTVKYECQQNVPVSRVHVLKAIMPILTRIYIWSVEVSCYYLVLVPLLLCCLYSCRCIEPSITSCSWVATDCTTTSWFTSVTIYTITCAQCLGHGSTWGRSLCCARTLSPLFHCSDPVFASRWIRLRSRNIASRHQPTARISPLFLCSDPEIWSRVQYSHARSIQMHEQRHSMHTSAYCIRKVTVVILKSHWI